MSAPAPQEFAIEVSGLVKKFGDFTAVGGISLQIRAGGCVGILGPNGAGKTTTIELLEGLTTPTSGSIRLLGSSWAESGKRLRERIGIQLQETRFPDRNTVEETLRLFRSFYPRGLTVEEGLELVQLGAKRKALVLHLSGGQRQRLALAVALMGDPEILFLDEPTTGLDPQSRRALWEVIEDLKRRGRTILMTTHYMEEADRLCDRLIIMDKGQIVSDGSPARLIAEHGGSKRIELTVQPFMPASHFQALPGVVAVEARPEMPLRLLVDEVHTSLPKVLEEVHRAGATLQHLTVHQPTLDDVFLTLAGRSLREEQKS